MGFFPRDDDLGFVGFDPSLPLTFRLLSSLAWLEQFLWRFKWRELFQATTRLGTIRQNSDWEQPL
jgi:hypothetical protein